MKKWKNHLLTAVVIGCCFFSGCQPTPEENAVVSRAEGLNEQVVAEPMQEGEKRETDIPAHWKKETLKNKNRMLFQADIDLEEMELGNLPVIEMKNYVLKEEELKNLVAYFAGEESLYEPKPYTKDIYGRVISMIENREGIYGSSYLWLTPLTTKQSAEAGMELAPESSEDLEMKEIKFKERFVDEEYEKAMTTKIKIDGFDLYKNREESVWFEADIGKERKSHIIAETYDSSIRNRSSFTWMEGAEILSREDFNRRRMFYEFQMDNPFTAQLLERIDQFEQRFKNEIFDKAEGKTQAEQILKELDISNMTLASEEAVLWFSDEICPSAELKLGDWDNFFWMVTPEDGEFGYRYTFSREIGGLHVLNGNSAVIEQTEEMYAPPFPAETITITVTESGAKAFAWDGMSEEVKVIAENTKLLPFEKIGERLEEQLFYWYSACTKGQPEDDPTQFVYQVQEAKLGYTYITAYQNPDHAWLVPAWTFLLTEGKSGVDFQYLPYTIEALEGRTIVQN